MELLRVRTQSDIDKQALQMKINLLSKKCEEHTAKIVELKKMCQAKDEERKVLSSTIDKQQNELNSSTRDAVQNEIISCLLNGVKTKEKYSQAVRAFGFKLHCYSPRGYEFVRSVFNKNLPHTSTIKAWYRNSNTDTEPGINQISLMMLGKKACEMKANKQQLVCCLIFDEMSIRKHIQWCSKTKKFLGYVTYGNNSNEIANNAIVFFGEWREC